MDLRFWVLIGSNLGQVIGPQTRWFVRVHSLGPSLSRSSDTRESTWRLGCLVSASHFRRGTNDSLGKAACKRLKHGCDPIQVKTSLGDIESILESILFAAIRELRLLGVAIDPPYKRAVLAALGARNKKRKREEKFRISEEAFYGFVFIAGYTAGGAPYGITIEEAKSLTNADLSYSDATPSTSDDDIPF
jgi:hypothetical protein